MQIGRPDFIIKVAAGKPFGLVRTEWCAIVTGNGSMRWVTLSIVYCLVCYSNGGAFESWIVVTGLSTVMWGLERI